MRKELRYHPHIYQEIKDGYDWYESRASGLGEDFLKELERAYSVIQNLPDTWPVMKKELGIRRYLLKRFPYGLFTK
jgi:hypothetical protein